MGDLQNNLGFRLITFSDETTPDPNELNATDTSKFERSHSSQSTSSANRRNDTNAVHSCDVCGRDYKAKDFKRHKKSEQHRLARCQIRREKRNQLTQPQAALAETLNTRYLAPDIIVQEAAEEQQLKINQISTKKKYYLRPGNDLPEENRQYIDTLVTFLLVKHAFNSDVTDVKISTNDESCREFGDVVIEITDYQNVTEIYALQCKQVIGRNDISSMALTAEKAKFSIKRQCEILSTLRKKKNSCKTYYILFTASDLKDRKNKNGILYDECSLDSWKSENNKNVWRNRRLTVGIYRKRHVVSTNDGAEDGCIFRIIQNGVSLLEEDLNKFCMLVSQRREKTLKNFIKAMIQDKFETNRDISSDLVKFVRAYFKTEILVRKFAYKLTKEDILLEIANLLLTPNVLLPEVTIEERFIRFWIEAIQNFDVVIVKNHFDVINKIYASVNDILKTEIDRNLDMSSKILTISKYTKGINESLKQVIFHNIMDDSVKMNLNCVYKTLWKTGFAPLILSADEESHLSVIIRIITALKLCGVSRQFIVARNWKLSFEVDIPEQLRSFKNLKDLEAADQVLYSNILDCVKIPILDFSLTLREIIDINVDFVQNVKPGVLLNMLFDDFSFGKTRNVSIPDTGFDYTIVVNEDVIHRVRKYFAEKGYDRLKGKECLSYDVHVGGNIKRSVLIPPDI